MDNVAKFLYIIYESRDNSFKRLNTSLFKREEFIRVLHGFCLLRGIGLLAFSYIFGRLG